MNSLEVRIASRQGFCSGAQKAAAAEKHVLMSSLASSKAIRTVKARRATGHFLCEQIAVFHFDELQQISQKLLTSLLDGLGELQERPAFLGTFGPLPDGSPEDASRRLPLAPCIHEGAGPAGRSTGDSGDWRSRTWVPEA